MAIIYPIKDFFDIPDPTPDSTTGFIGSIFYHAGNTIFTKHRFDNYRLTELRHISVYMPGGPEIPCEVTFYKKDIAYKTLRVKCADVDKHLPKEWKGALDGLY